MTGFLRLITTDKGVKTVFLITDTTEAIEAHDKELSPLMNSIKPAQ